MPHCAECDCYVSERYVQRVGYTNGEGEPLCAECSDTYDGTVLVTDGGRDVAIDRRETITAAADGDLQIGERETVAALDDVCATLEALRDEVEHPEVKRALRSAVGHAWKASVLQRVDENNDVRLITTDSRGGRDVE